MRLTFNSELYKERSIQIDRLNLILAPNSGGKTLLCSYLKEGFDGKLNSSFLLDGNAIDKNQFIVYYIGDSDSIDNEKSLSSKSILRSYINTNLGILEENDQEEIVTQLKILTDLVNDKVLKDIDSHLANLSFNISLNDLILKNNTMVIDGINLEHLSFSKKRVSYIDLIIENIKKTNRSSVVIVDEWNLGLSEYSSKLLLTKLKDLSQSTNTYVFISSSRSMEDINKIYVKKELVYNTLIDMDAIIEEMCRLENCSKEDFIEFNGEEEMQRFLIENDIENKVEEYFLSDGNEIVEKYIKDTCIFKKDELK